MNVRKVAALLRRVQPLKWPVTVRSRRLPYPFSARIRTVYRQDCPTHLIELHSDADSMDLLHEWAHAVQREVYPSRTAEGLDDKLQQDLEDHDDSHLRGDLPKRVATPLREGRWTSTRVSTRSGTTDISTAGPSTSGQTMGSACKATAGVRSTGRQSRRVRNTCDSRSCLQRTGTNDE